MSSTVMVDCSAVESTVIYCEECNDESQVGKGFFEGQAAMQRHMDMHPSHLVVYLKREVV